MTGYESDGIAKSIAIQIFSKHTTFTNDWIS